MRVHTVRAQPCDVRPRAGNEKNDVLRRFTVFYGEGYPMVLVITFRWHCICFKSCISMILMIDCNRYRGKYPAHILYIRIGRMVLRVPATLPEGRHAKNTGMQLTATQNVPPLPVCMPP